MIYTTTKEKTCKFTGIRTVITKTYQKGWFFSTLIKVEKQLFNMNGHLILPNGKSRNEFGHEYINTAVTPVL